MLVLALAPWQDPTGGAPAKPEEPSPSLGAPTMPSQQTSTTTADDERNRQRLLESLDSQAGPIDAERYVLGPGDVLQLEFWGRVERSVTIPVDPQGKIFVKGYGALDLGGQTLAHAQREMARIVQQRFVGVKTQLLLLRMRRFKVYLSGQVARSGAVEVTPVMRASELVTRIGLVEGASRRNIAVRRRDGSVARLDLTLYERAGRTDQDPLLLDGDVLFVPASKEFIEVHGAVANPGRYECASGDSLSTLLQIGGGLLPSARRRALLVRFDGPSRRDSTWFDIDEHEVAEINPSLRDGDHVFVYFTADYHVLPQVEILGEIARPGRYPIVIGFDRLSNVVYMAQGFRPLADRSTILLVRGSQRAEQADPEFERLARLSRSEMTESEYAVFQTKLSTRTNSVRVDFAQIEKRGEDVDPLLRDGDLIRVEQRVPSVRVDGQVRRPGWVQYAPGRTVAEYVELAGGYTGRASRDNMRVSHSQTGQVIPARSVASIEPGDFIWVPERRDVDGWAVFRDIITVAAQIAVIAVAFRR